MSSNIDTNKLKKWMRKNYWFYDHTGKHEVWILQIRDNEDNELIYSVLTINMHRSKGRGIAEDALKDISKEMKLSKQDLVEYIRQDKKIDWNKYK